MHKSEGVQCRPRVTSANCDSRSEEHTSELQSRLHLVCRLLLEKKKKEHLLGYPRPIRGSICQPPGEAGVHCRPPADIGGGCTPLLAPARSSYLNGPPTVYRCSA